MSLTYRPTTPADVTSCLSILDARYGYGAVDRRALIAFWRSLLETQVALSRVVEDRGSPGGAQILGFGMSVFVTDEFMDEVKTTLPQLVGRQTFLRWQKGHRVFLDRGEIARENTTGNLNLLVVAYGSAGAGEDIPIRSRLYEALLDCHGGYAIKEISQEMFGTDDRSGALGLGLKVIREFVDPAPGEADGDRFVISTLMGLDRDGCAALGPFWSFFHPPLPRFQFRNRDREMLEAALFKATDEEISRALKISIGTLKKRWQRIYEEVELRAPDLLSTEPAANEIEGGRSTTQRRRHLIEYLRQHLEEIRPRLERRPTSDLGRRLRSA